MNDWYGRMLTRNYPSGFEVDYSYSLNGNYQSAGKLNLTYEDGGNITYKSDVGWQNNYGENNAGPHALTSVEAAFSGYKPPPQIITYTDFR